ncbi:SIS domain-containing protein [Candidatus Marinimicrobia bacterium MT.SAG.4]|nr:SIS domain-containing protein [Candidatus Marinimicrobia bacterium MT.SAG.4]
MEFFDNYFIKMIDGLQSVDKKLLEAAVKSLMEVSAGGGKVIIAGNGGSAAMASHTAVDLTKNAQVRSINFNESDLITCFANDFGYEKWIEKSLEYYADPGDSVILISSSGSSINILNAADKAKKMGLKLITFSGFSPDNQLRDRGDLNFYVDSEEYNIVEMSHHIWLVAMVDRIIDLRSVSSSS